MVDTKQRTTLKKLARWNGSSNTSKGQYMPPLSQDAPFLVIPYDKLQQGGLYILKVKQVTLALFEGWDDDMCCFSILRSEVEPMRWSEARQLPGDFDIYDAFDDCGNPPIHLWSRYLRVSVPTNWFAMFEEARRRQRDWAIQQHNLRNSLIQQNPNEYYYPIQPDNQHPTYELEDPAVPSVVGYSNTDVSSMQLNQTVVSPSIVASTNIVDPSILNEAVSNQQYHPATNNSFIKSRNGSNAHSVSQQSVVNKENIRRHIAPGQASIKHRNTPGSTSPHSMPSLIHHRSKEYVTHTNENQTNEGSTPTNNDDSAATTPPLPTPNMEKPNLETFSSEETPTITTPTSNTPPSNFETLKHESSFSTDLDFPHDSDRFSIRSDIVTSPKALEPVVSQKSKHRSSMKKLIFG